MKKFIEKVTFNDSAASESSQGSAPGAEKVMPYVAPRVKVVKFRMELGVNGSNELIAPLGANTEEMNARGWDMGHSQSVGTEEMNTSTDWGTFQ